MHRVWSCLLRAAGRRGLALATQLDLQPVVAHTRACMGTLAHALGDCTLARTQIKEGVALARRVDDRIGMAWALYNLGCLALDQDDNPAARAWLSESVSSFPEFDRLGFVHGLAVFARLSGRS